MRSPSTPTWMRTSTPEQTTTSSFDRHVSLTLGTTPAWLPTLLPREGACLQPLWCTVSENVVTGEKLWCVCFYCWSNMQLVLTHVAPLPVRDAFQPCCSGLRPRLLLEWLELEVGLWWIPRIYVSGNKPCSTIQLQAEPHKQALPVWGALGGMCSTAVTAPVVLQWPSTN